MMPNDEIKSRLQSTLGALIGTIIPSFTVYDIVASEPYFTAYDDKADAMIGTWDMNILRQAVDFTTAVRQGLK
jgi:hypothetical protein